MAFIQQNNFRGKINNKNNGSFIEKLDFTLSQKDRVQLTQDLLYTNEIKENKFLDEYFEVYFDKKFNSNINKETPISSNNNVCRTLEAMANYILFADDVPKIRKTEYNFYTLMQLQARFGKELSLDALLERTYKKSTEEYKISFLIDAGKNYKKPKEQHITAEDIKTIQPVAEYEYLKSILSQRLQLLRKTKQNKGLQRKYICLMKDLKTDSILCKDKIRGTIYFNSPLMDSTVPDFNEFDLYDLSHIVALLECKGSMITDVGCLVYDLRQLIENAPWKENEVMLINHLYSGLNSFEISRKLEKDHRETKMKIKTLGRKIIRQYELEVEDWYYTFIRKGTYKKCEKCNQIKLAFTSRFYFNKDGKDGLHSLCKICKLNWDKKVHLKK